MGIIVFLTVSERGLSLVGDVRYPCEPSIDRVFIRWVTWWPVSYWTERFNHLASRDDVDFEAIFLAGGSTLLESNVDESSWKFRHKFLSKKSDDTGYLEAKLRFPRPWPLVRGRFDALVMTYSEASCIAAAVLCWILRKPYFLFTGSTKYTTRKAGRVKELVKRILLERATGIFVTGPLQRDYVIEYVEDRTKVSIIGNPTASLEAGRYSSAEARERLRTEFGWQEDEVIVLYVGRLSSEKGLLTLLDALGKLHETHKRGGQPRLVLVGSGPQETELRSRASELGLRVQFTGFLRQDELARRYAAADVFVLPSQSEPWGLVVNEAMEFGLPLILSSNVGCASVLLREGENGLIFAAGDQDALAKYMDKMRSDKDLRQQMGSVSNRIILEHSMERWGDEVVSAVKAAATDDLSSGRALREG